MVGPCVVMSTDLTRLATPHIITWAIIALAILGVIARPFRWPEFVWAGAGAILLVVLRLLTPATRASTSTSSSSA